MSEHEFMGMFVVSLVSLVGLFFAIYRPLNENTKAMTQLTVRVEELTKQWDKHEDEFERYKEHVSESQKRQWDAINRHEEQLTILKKES